MHTAPPDGTLPVSSPTHNHNPDPDRQHHDGNGDDNGNGSNGNGGNPASRCAELLEELNQRLGDLEALTFSACTLLADVPRDPSPSVQTPMRRLWRMVERIHSDASAALQFAEAAVAVVRSAHGEGDA